MLGTFRKHSTWLWGIIIAAMAVSLVVWTGKRGDRGDGRRAADLGSISGRSVTLDEYMNAAREVRLQHRIERGEWPSSSADQEQEIYQRLFLIQKEEEM